MTTDKTGSLDDWPPYSCLILEALDGRFIMELRPASAKRAAGSVTCFGGTREAGETADECLIRELDEELGWRPVEFSRTVDLWRDDKPLAWFYVARFPHVDIPDHREEGHTTILLNRPELLLPPVSPWHRAALRAHFNGVREVSVDEMTF
jgi:8-oxo-dGTP pyrophosphatase MutT (NUDIX family)